mgnify:CR=1 FL=1
MDIISIFLIFLIAGSGASIPIIDVLVQEQKSPPPPYTFSQAKKNNQIELETQAHFILHSLPALHAKRHWLRPLRMTFSIHSMEIYYRNQLLRSCFNPFPESSREILPSYWIQHIQEFSPVFPFSQPSQFAILVSSVSITLTLPE